jgi:O-antigen ligase
MPESASETRDDRTPPARLGGAMAIVFAVVTLAIGAWLVVQVRAQAGSPAAPGMRAIESVPVGWLMVIAAAFAALAATPWRPEVGLLTYVVVSHLLPRYGAAAFAAAKTQTLTWFAGLALAGWSVYLLFRGRKPLPINRWLLAAMLAFFAWLGVSAVAALLRNQPWNPHPNHHPLLFAQALCMFLLASQLLRDQMAAARMGGALGVTLMLRWLISGSGGVDTEGDIAALCVLAMPLAALGAMACRGAPGKAAFAVLGVGLVVLLSQTRNRNAAVAFVIMLPALWLMSRQKKRILVTALPMLLVLALLFLNSSYWQRFSALVTGGDDANSARQRLVIWESAWNMAKAHPVLGVGVGEFHNHVLVYAPLNQPIKLDSRFAAHNNLFHVLGESGFPGAALYLTLFLASLAWTWLAVRRLNDNWPAPAARMVFVALCVYLAIGLFISRHDMVLGYLLAGWAAGITIRPLDSAAFETAARAE